MILKLSKTKRLSFYRKTEIYIGEKDFDEIQVLIPSEVDENDTSELTFKLHLVNERGEYAIRTLTVEQEGTKLVGSTNITADLTSIVQEFSVYIEMVKGNDEIIGKTNVLEIEVNPLPDEQGEIIPEEIERRSTIISQDNPPESSHKKYKLNAFWINYTDKTQFVLTSINESQAPEKYMYTWERNNNHVVVSTEVAPEYTPNNVDYKYSNGDIWVQTDLDSDKIISISVCTGYTKESIDGETWRYNYTWAVLTSGSNDYTDLTNKPSINNVTLSGNKTSDDLSLQSKLTAGNNITIDEDNVISAEGGGVTSYNDLTNKPQINGVTLSGNDSSDYLGLQKKLHLNTNDLLFLEEDGDLYLYDTRILRSSQRSNITDLNKLYGNTMIYIGHPTNVAHVPSELSPGSIGLVIPIDFTVPNSLMWYTAQIYIEPTIFGPNIFVRTVNHSGTSYPDSFTPWVKLNGGAQIVSGVVNANGTITFTDSDGNTFTTTGSSVIGPQGDDYILTAQDKSDIADIVLGELPTTQGVLYGNQSN